MADLSPAHLAAIRAFTPEAIARLAWSRERVREEQTRRLRRIAAHAHQASPFFARRLKDVNPETLTLDDLAALPVLTKADVMENWDQLVTDPRLRLADIFVHLQRLKSSEQTNPYYLEKFYASATGGSSGKRGVFLWDWETVVVTTNIAYRLEARSDTAAPPAGPRRTAVVCAGSPVHASNMVFPISLDPRREMRVFPAGTPIPELVGQLNAWRPDRLVGYASLVQELAAEALEGRLDVRLNRISTNSEPLLPEARAMALQAWGVNIHDTWGSVEIGVAAHEGDSFSGLTLAEDFLIFEPVDGGNRPCDPANAERMLVTKLFGEIMPMIRYEMTDALILDESPNPDAPGLRRIHGIKGRSDAWFTYPGGLRVHPMVFRDVLGQEPHISEYQVRQTGTGADIFVVAHGAMDLPGLTRALQSSLAQAGLANALVALTVVSEIPRHAETNKLVRFVPLPA